MEKGAGSVEQESGDRGQEPVKPMNSREKAQETRRKRT